MKRKRERENTQMRMQAGLDDGAGELKLLNELLEKELSRKVQELKAKDQVECWKAQLQ